MSGNTVKSICTLTLVFLLFVAPGQAAVLTFTDSAAYAKYLSDGGYTTIFEGFEDAGAWGGARTPDTAASVTSQGVVWTSNHPATNEITTSIYTAVSGDYGAFDPDHGYATGTEFECDVDNPPEKCLYHDGLSGTRLTGLKPFVAVGGVFKGTHGASVGVVLDGGPVIGLGKLLNNDLYFYGVVDTDGFTSFEIRELESKIGNKLLIFTDDVTMGLARTGGCTPVSVTDTTCDGVDDDCNGLVDDGYIPDASCGVGQCLANNTSSSCVNGKETLCIPGTPLPENTEPVCTDRIDNDCDGLTDGADPNCPACFPTGVSETICNGVDDDCDGKIDENYAVNSSCGIGQCLANNTPSSCVKGIETPCLPGTPSPEDSEPTCTDTLDNDCDGLVDAVDTGCGGSGVKRFPWNLFLPAIIHPPSNPG